MGRLNRVFPRMDLYIGTSRAKKIHVDRRKIAGAGVKMRAVFASDLHLRGNVSPDPIIECIMAQRPDVILLGGDFAEGRDQAFRMFEAFRRLRAPMGIYAVPGNNDIEAVQTLDALRAALAECGVRLLVNESVQLDRIALAGVDEVKYGCPEYEHLFAGRMGYRVLLSHYPVKPKGGLHDLMLAGHTHGGQFNACGWTVYAIGGERVGGTNWFAPMRVSGYEDAGETKLLVSKGIGMSRIPLRIGVRPEIHVIEFDC